MPIPLAIPIIAAGAMATKKAIDAYSAKKATNSANSALEAEKINAAGLNADTQALMNPNMQNQIQTATDAAMGQFGGSGNLYSTAARNAVADRAQAIASNEWSTAAQRAMDMRRNNTELTAAIQGNKLAASQQNPINEFLFGGAPMLSMFK